MTDLYECGRFRMAVWEPWLLERAAAADAKVGRLIESGACTLRLWRSPRDGELKPLAM